MDRKINHDQLAINIGFSYMLHNNIMQCRKGNGVITTPIYIYIYIYIATTYRFWCDIIYVHTYIHTCIQLHNHITI